jgi:uncharacterized protein
VARISVVLLLAWLVLSALAWGLQRHLIYLPDRDAPAVPEGVEVVRPVTDDALELEAWRVAPEGEAQSTVLVTPGNAGNRALRMPLAEGLVERGHEVVLVDYRGYGGNPGRPSEDGLLKDARAALDFLLAEDQAVENRLVFLGESIGTGVAAALAAEHPPAVLALRSPFPRLEDVGAAHYPFLPVRTLLRERFPTLEHLRGVEVPTLIVAGGADTIVPTALSRQVADATGADYVEVPGAHHNDRALLDGAEYLDAVDRFVRAHLP